MGRLGWTLTAALAPAAWGTTFLVTTELLPEGRPLLAGVLRALPAAIFAGVLLRQLVGGEGADGDARRPAVFHRCAKLKGGSPNGERARLEACG